jgi:hypothetical protein
MDPAGSTPGLPCVNLAAWLRGLGWLSGEHLEGGFGPAPLQSMASVPRGPHSD